MQTFTLQPAQHWSVIMKYTRKQIIIQLCTTDVNVTATTFQHSFRAGFEEGKWQEASNAMISYVKHIFLFFHLEAEVCTKRQFVWRDQ